MSAARAGVLASYAMPRRLPLVFVCLLALGGCGPSPSALCDHIAEIARAEAKGGEAPLDAARCASSLERKREQWGGAAWSKRASCMLDAQSLAEIDAC